VVRTRARTEDPVKSNCLGNALALLVSFCCYGLVYPLDFGRCLRSLIEVHLPLHLHLHLHLLTPVAAAGNGATQTAGQFMAALLRRGMGKPSGTTSAALVTGSAQGTTSFLVGCTRSLLIVSLVSVRFRFLVCCLTPTEA
jgi:hypothetical protein